MDSAASARNFVTESSSPAVTESLPRAGAMRFGRGPCIGELEVVGE